MATPTKWGPEFLVNTTKSDSQHSPTITTLADGRFIVAWADARTSDNSGVRAQLYNADGSESGGELLITKAANWFFQAAPGVAALPDGDFVAAWTRPHVQVGGGGGHYAAVQARIFEADGSKSGEPFSVNTKMASDQFIPTVTTLMSGRFVAAWSGGDELLGGDVRARIFEADGSKVGGQFVVNTTTVDNQSEPTIASLADGGFVVAWTDQSESGGDTSAYAVRAQVFDADGSKLGGEILVNTTTDSLQQHPTATGLDDGRFVVAWTDLSADSGIRAQIFNADGSKSGGELLVSAPADGSQWEPAIAALADGRFVVAWMADVRGDADTSDWAVHAQVLNPDGSKSGDAFLVNTTTDDDQRDPTVTALPDGRFVVAWEDQSESGGDKSNAAVRAQIFDPREEAIDLTGGSLGEQFVGTRFDDVINGAGGKDRLNGDDGNDTLEGGRHKDQLKGGKDEDQFVFAEMGKKHADKIKDFKVGTDLIVLDGDVFTGIGAELGGSQFEVGKKADGGKDRVIYDRDKGKLWWDGDGKGGDDPVLFAKLDDGPKLGHEDFLII